MGSWTSDQQLLDLMRSYVVATNRLEVLELREVVNPEVLAAVREAQRQAARAFEDALLARGWQIPGVPGHEPAAPRPGDVIGF